MKIAPLEMETWLRPWVCTTYGPQAAFSPRELFLWPVRAFSIAENVAKARLRV